MDIKRISYISRIPTLVLLATLFPVFFSNAEGPTPRVESALSLLKSKTAALGEPKVLDGALMFGDKIQNDDFTIVDAVQKEAGDACTATLFIKDEDNFRRIATNVMADGGRAIGTVLDVRGPVYKSLLKGDPFYGVIDVVGTLMETGYEAILDASGNIIGVYFVGFPVPK